MENTMLRKLRDNIGSKIDKLNNLDLNHKEILNDNDVRLDNIIKYEISKNKLLEVDLSKINILYVDDERNNLNSFHATFREYYNIFLADKIDDAMNILKNNKINIVISDQKMPGLTGIEFLQKIENEFINPPTFILISAYIEKDKMNDVLNGINIFKFLNKPFNVEEIKYSIKDAYSYYLNK